MNLDDEIFCYCGAELTTECELNNREYGECTDLQIRLIARRRVENSKCPVRRMCEAAGLRVPCADSENPEF